MKNKNTKNLFLEQLKRVPVVQISCEKVGISRASVYRWRNEDKEFSKQMDDALAEGVALANDLAETQLLNSIREKNMAGIVFWLRNRHDAYRQRVQVEGKLITTNELNEEQRALVGRALKLAMPQKRKNENQYDENGEKIIFKRR